MYACGGRGDLWRFDGSHWYNTDIPTNVGLKNVCCAKDGFVYVTTDRKEILRGRNDEWDIVTQDLTDEVFEGIVEFEQNVIVSTVSSLYRVDGGTFRPANLDEPQMESRAHIAAGDGVLVVAGRECAAIFDGSSWATILDRIP